MKLALQDRLGGKIVVSRKLKAAVKGKMGNVGMTSMEQTLNRIAADGTKTTLSAKCIDMKVLKNQNA